MNRPVSGPQDPNGTAQALLSAGDLCWSPPARAELVRRGARPVRGRDTLGEFLLIPSASRPRLLVPAGAPAAASESVRRFSHALGWRERALRTALTGALRTGLLDRVVPDRMRITAPSGQAEQVQSLQAHLSDVLGEPVVLSLGVGTARANRKPVLEAISHSGQPLAFVKLGDSDVTRSLLATEASALSRLAVNPVAGLRVPQLIGLSDWNGVSMLVQSALPTPAWRIHRAATLPFAAMRALVTTFDAGRRPLTESPSWQQICAGLPIADDARAAMFGQIAETLGAALDGRELRHAAWHGDWTPWNMAWTVRQVRIWDWERFAEGVPAGFDPLHYLLAQHMVRMPWTAALDAVRAFAPEALRQAGVAPSEAELVLHWYFLELCRRYLVSASAPSGTPLRPRADGLLSHLFAALHPGEAVPPLPVWNSQASPASVPPISPSPGRTT